MLILSLIVVQYPLKAADFKVMNPIWNVTMDYLCVKLNIGINAFQVKCDRKCKPHKILMYFH